MSTTDNKPIAIIGMGCRLPGAHNINEFLKMLDEGLSDLGELPPERMNRELQFHPEKGEKAKAYTTLGGIIPPKPFDLDACPISKELLELSHPSHLKLLEVTAEAFQQGGIDPKKFQDKIVGTYLGHTPPTGEIAPVMFARMIGESAQSLQDVQSLDALDDTQTEEVIQEIIDEVRSDIAPDDPRINMRSNAFHAASLISEAFELDGPSMSFDAACASGFQALNFAILALQQGKLDAAVVGSASYCQGDTLVLFSAAQSLTTNGTCPYDESADGLVASEGYAIFVLKTLDQAIEDGDNIQAVIRSVGMSSDGKGKSLWAPRKEGQAEAVVRANEKLENPYQNIQYIEMHATSTQVGDATEMSALADVFGDRFPEGYKIPIGGVKANVGHTLETAGLAGLLKTVLSIQKQTVYPQINIKSLNPKIEWDNVPFFVPQQKLNWPPPAPGVPRRAAVNAFGIGGLNVHVIVDEYLPTALPETSSQETNDNDEAIAVIGMGSIFPGALTTDALWETIQSGIDQKCEVPEGRWASKKMLDPDPESQWGVNISKGGFVQGYEYDWKKHKVPPKQIHNADPLQFMLLDAADAALEDAGYQNKEYDKTRTGVVVGIIFGGEFANHLQVGMRLPDFKVLLRESLQKRGLSEEEIAQVYDEYEDIILDKMPALVDETGSFTSSTFASRITKTFNLMGGAVAVDSGDASAISAIEACTDILLAGNCDMMICAAGQRAMSFCDFKTYSNCGVLAKDRPLGAFNAESDGGLLGEGAGVLVLKRLSDAVRDGDNIQAIIRGTGVSRTSELKNSIQSAAKRAFESSHIHPENISLIETSSYGQPENDKAELAGLADSYSTPQLKKPIPIGNAASQFGNVGGGTGILSVIKAVKELNNTSIPKQVSFEDEMPLLAPYKKTLKPVAASQQIPGINDDGKLYAGVSCYGQQNRAYHLILEGMTRVTPEPASNEITPAVTTPESQLPLVSDLAGWRITRIGAVSFNELQSSLAIFSANADDLFNASNADFNLNPFSDDDSFRIAIVSENSAQLAKNCQLASKMIANPESRGALADKGIFFSELNSVTAKVAFMFPGQGSQYPGMLKDLITHYPPAQEAMNKADAVLADLNLPSFAELAWTEGDHLGQDVWLTQLSLIIADTIMSSTINSLGIPVEAVSGHSFGELAAHVAAGTWTFREAVIATRKRCDAIASCQGSIGALLSTSAPQDALEDLIKVKAANVSISHCNSPTQTVVGGDVAELESFAEIVKQVGYQAKLLNVPAAFHTPLMEDVKLPFGESLKQLKMSPPRIPVLSSVSNRYVSDPDEIRYLIVTQMTCPIDYVGLVERLLQDGINILIEVGPRSVLTGLHRQIIEDNSIQCISTDHQKRNGLQQLLFTRACVEVSGILDQPKSTFPQWEDSTALSSSVSHFDTKDHQPEEVHPVEDLKIVHLSGSPYERGVQHGQELQNSIRAILKRHSDLAGTQWSNLHNLKELATQAEAFYGVEGLQEIQGIAEGARVNQESLIAHNLRLYLDAGYGGLFFAVTAQNSAENNMLHAVNEDLRYGQAIKECLERIVFVNHSNEHASYLTFGLPGQIGGLNGMNSEGVAITSAVLLDTPHNSNQQPAKLQTTLIKELLQHSKNINDAVNLASSCLSYGAWNICISHHPTDSLCYLEFDGKELRVLASPPMVVATNHQMNSTSPTGESQIQSHSRLQRLKELIGDESHPQMTMPNAQKALRDQYDSQSKESNIPSMNTLRRVDNQMSIIMQPSAGKLWVTPGPLANGHQNIFQELSIADIFSQQSIPSTSLKPTSLKSLSNKKANPFVATNSELFDAYQISKQSDQKKICHRMVMRVVEQPLVTGSSTMAERLSGHCIVLGNNEVADAFSQNLRDNGVVVEQLAVSSDLDQSISLFDEIWNRTEAKHLFILTSFDASDQTGIDFNLWNERRSTGVFIPFFLTQRWMQRLIETKTVENSSLMATTLLGGDFGFSNNVQLPEGGALTGLMKAVKAELTMMGNQKNYKARAVDFSSTMTTSQIVEALNSEVTTDDDEFEIAYHNGIRFVTRPMIQAAANKIDVNFPQNGCFVITGGARGVTARVAREIGRRYGVKLHLVGSSPLPEISPTYRTFSDAELKEVKTTVMKEALANGEKPMDAWGQFEKALEIDKTLHGFKEDGLTVQYHACDISNKSSVTNLLEEIRSSGDVICGLIHGAGYERACRFEKKKPELVDRTIGAKADGAVILMELTMNDPLQYFLAFGSVSGRFGGVGQADYSLSNDLLSKLIDSYRSLRPECHSGVFHWHAWDDAGMAVRPESQHIRSMMDLKFMPAVEGVQHLIDEIESGVPETEVVITEVAFYEKNYLPLIQSGSSITNEPQTTINSVAQQFPLIESVADYKPGEQTRVNLKFNPTEDIFLIDHTFKGRPMLPVVISTEALLQTSSLLLNDQEYITGVKNIEIINGMRFLDDQPQEMNVVAERTVDGISAALVADFRNRKGKLLLKDKPYLKGVVETSLTPSPLSGVKPVVTVPWHDCYYEADAPIVHGPTCQCVKNMAFVEGGGYSLIQAPSCHALEKNRTGNHWILQPALIDACLFASSVVMWVIRDGVVAIPHGIESIHFARQANEGEMCLAEIRARHTEEKFGTFDLTLYGEAGDVILKILGYKNIVVGATTVPSHVSEGV